LRPAHSPFILSLILRSCISFACRGFQGSSSPHDRAKSGAVIDVTFFLTAFNHASATSNSLFLSLEWAMYPAPPARDWRQGGREGRAAGKKLRDLINEKEGGRKGMADRTGFSAAHKMYCLAEQQWDSGRSPAEQRKTLLIGRLALLCARSIAQFKKGQNLARVRCRKRVNRPSTHRKLPACPFCTSSGENSTKIIMFPRKTNYFPAKRALDSNSRRHKNGGTRQKPHLFVTAAKQQQAITR
jgi:hypothetical protein